MYLNQIHKLAVALDMAGCPNRCRHCWLGALKNGRMGPEEFRRIAAAFRGWRDEEGRGIEELAFFSWWREPDFRDDYRELWELEKELSSPGCAERFELLSTWRLARDESYAFWAATLPPKACQITFFGMEENTDWGMRRRGAFRDQLAATERCRAAGIEPRWQLFLTKRSLHELDDFLRLLRDYAVKSFFIGGISPEGCGYEIEDQRLEEEDLALIPGELAALSRDGLGNLGRPEKELLPSLLSDSRPPLLDAPLTLEVDADYDVYPNLAEPAPWWKLGNLRSDGVDRIMNVLREGNTPGMDANLHLPISELARLFGDPEGKRLYTRSDMLCRFMHQWGERFMASARTPFPR